jgi:hypothetical protein
MAGSAFDYCAIVGTSDTSPCEKLYDQFTENLGEAFQGPTQDAITYSWAMGLGVAQLQQEAAADQRNPQNATAMLPELETDYQIIPQLGQSENERQLTALAASLLESGQLEANINTGLTAILGSDFINWRPLDIDNEVMVTDGDNTDSNWTLGEVEVNATVFDTAATPTGIAWHPGFNAFVAVNRGGTTSATAYSLDSGRTWDSVTAGGLSLKDWTSVCWHSGFGVNQLVAVCETSGGDTQSVATTTGMANWTLQTAITGTWKKVISAMGKLVAVGTSASMYSDSATSWTAGTITARAWTSMAAGNGIVLAVSSDGYAATSTDGITFTQTASGLGALVDVAFGNGVFVAVASTGTHPVRWSNDGVTWTYSTHGIASPSAYAITFCDGLFVFVESGSYDVWTSTDGKTFTSQRLQFSSTSLVPQHGWRALACKPNRIIGAGINVAAGQPGTAFTARVLPSPKLVPAATPIKHVSITDVVFPGTSTVGYSAILTDGNPIKVGDVLTVEPGRLGLQERVTVLWADTAQFQATFRRPHSAGTRATTAHWPSWRSTKRHSVVLVTAAAFSSPTKCAQVNLFMRKIMSAFDTWTIAVGNGGYTTPFAVGDALRGSLIGGMLEAG